MPTSNPSYSAFSAFAERLGKRDAIPFDEFVDMALYDPTIGYYSIDRKRVGRDRTTDFLTSASFGSLWGELIVAACAKIIDAERIERYAFVEIAAEPGQSILEGIRHPFGKTRVIRLGDEIDIPSPAVVYSNEWLDARPFKRFRFVPEEGCWHEVGVTLEEDAFREQILDASQTPGVRGLDFPADYKSPYVLDWPTGSIQTLRDLCDQPWEGLFLTFDYGLDRKTLLRERPQGTARGYFRHSMSTDLLSKVGEQDLTCHLCWDTLIEVLEKSAFDSVGLSVQESFLVNHADDKIREVFSEHASSSARMSTLKEILHPAHMGSKFQALWAKRNPSSPGGKDGLP